MQKTQQNEPKNATGTQENREHQEQQQHGSPSVQQQYFGSKLDLQWELRHVILSQPQPHDVNML